MLFNRLFRRAPPPPSFSVDLDGDDPGRLRAEMLACLNRAGGTLANLRRAGALSDLFNKLTPDGQRRYVDVLTSLDETAAVATSERYSEIEEAELFGRPSSKLAILDAFETPQRRILGQLKATRNGAQTMDAIRQHADDELKKSIDTI
jgi:hypothetical protein